MKFIWSAMNNAFIPETMQRQYVQAGWDLADAIPADDGMAAEYMGEAPTGKMRVAGDDGLPAWGYIPEIPTNPDAETF